MNTSIALRMYKGKQQIYDGVQCIADTDQTKIQEWFMGLCETTIGDDIDDIVRVKHSDVVTLDSDQDLYTMQMVTAYTLRNGTRYAMLGYAKFYGES